MRVIILDTVFNKYINNIFTWKSFTEKVIRVNGGCDTLDGAVRYFLYVTFGSCHPDVDMFRTDTSETLSVDSN